MNDGQTEPTPADPQPTVIPAAPPPSPAPSPAPPAAPTPRQPVAMPQEPATEPAPEPEAPTAEQLMAHARFSLVTTCALIRKAIAAQAVSSGPVDSISRKADLLRNLEARIHEMGADATATSQPAGGRPSVLRPIGHRGAPSSAGASG